MALLSTYMRVILYAATMYAGTANGFPYGDMAQEHIWDVNRCSNINPIVDGRTVLLTANGKWPEDKFCTAIRRDLKVADGEDYQMTTQFNNLSGNKIGSKIAGHLGFMFNVWDDYNYDFVYKR